MPDVVIRGESIRLGQLLKLSGVADDGAHARILIESGLVRVDSRVETRRGAQVQAGSRVEVEGEQFTVRTA